MTTKDILLLLRTFAELKDPSADDRQQVAEFVARPLFARFFFGRASGEGWAEFAADEILTGKLDEEGAWVRLRFVLAAYERAPHQLLATLSALRPRISRWMSREVVATALKQTPEIAWALRSFVMDSVLNPEAAIAPDVGGYLSHVSKIAGSDLQELLIVVGAIVSFIPDPKQKQDAEKEMGRNPVPRVDTWSYQQILETGIRPLARLYPLGIAKALTDAVADLMQLKQRGEDSGERYDTSRGWCANVAKPTSQYVDADESLVHALTFACDQVYASPAGITDQVRALDGMLRSQRWLLFTRIRHHCYAEHPVVCREWCVQVARSYQNYGDSGYPPDIAAVLRQASEQLGGNFLSESERAAIFDKILSSKRAEEFIKERQEEPTPSRLQNLRAGQRRRDLWPFEPVLFSAYREAYISAVALVEDTVSLDTYDPLQPGGGIHSVEVRSPKTEAELASMPDAELLAYLNTWNEVGRDKKEWWVETTHDGLAAAFKRTLAADPARFADWGKRWQDLLRPRHVRAALDFASEEVKAGTHLRLTPWISLAGWALKASSPDSLVGSDAGKDDSVSEWTQVRRTVVDFLGACFESKVPFSPELRRQLSRLTLFLCTEPDPWLEKREHSRDPLTDAINTTRGRALEVLVQLGFWLRDAAKLERGRCREIRAVLTRRFAHDPELTVPEFAQLGRLFPFLINLDPRRSSHYRTGIFPPDHTEEWQAAFGTLVQYTQAQRPLFPFLSAEFDRGLLELHAWHRSDRGGREFIQRLGQHLFLYFVWGCFELTDGLDPLSRFYSETKSEDWKNLMDFAGRLLANSPNLPPDIRTRCETFFAFRLAFRDITELDGFNSWLEAEGFTPKWRLVNLLESLAPGTDRKRLSSIEVKRLVNLLPHEPALTVEALAMLTSRSGATPGFYFDAKDIWPILEAGLGSPEGRTRDWAEKAQNNLLEAGLFEYLERPKTG